MTAPLREICVQGIQVAQQCGKRPACLYEILLAATLTIPIEPMLLCVPRASPIARENVALPFVCHDRAVLLLVSGCLRPSPPEEGLLCHNVSSLALRLRDIDVQRVIHPSLMNLIMT